MLFFLFFFFCISCAPTPGQDSPPAPLAYADEKSLNKALKSLFPQDALAAAEAHPQFASVRVRLLVLENLVEAGRYKNAALLGEELLALPVQSPQTKSKRSAKASRRSKKAPKGSLKREGLTESQAHKVYFYMALAFQGLEKEEETDLFFQKTRGRPHYFYLYRYAQFQARRGKSSEARSLFEESYARSEGRFDYINEAFARFLTDSAEQNRRAKPEKSKEALLRVLSDRRLWGSPAGARAEILWAQWRMLPGFGTEKDLFDIGAPVLPGKS